MKSKHFQLRLLTAIPLLLAAILLSSCSKEASIEGSLAKATQYMEEENYSSAEIELRNVMQQEALHPQAILLLGELYFEQGRFREAFPYLNTARELQPEDLENRKRRATLLMLAQQPDAARDEAQFVLEQDPSDDLAPLLLADASQAPETIADSRRFLQSLETTPATLAALGYLDLKEQSVAVGNGKFIQALDADPDYYPALTARFAILSSQGNTEAAAEALERAAQAAPARSGVQTRYARFLSSEQQDPEAAAAYLETVLEEAPDYLPALSMQAELLAQLDRIDEAKKLSDRALRLDRLDPTALRLRGVFAAMEEKYDQAIVALEGMLERYPNDIKANYQLALAYLATEQSDKAKAPLQRVARQAPQNFEAAALLASVQSQEGDTSGAIITLQRLVENRPNSPEAKLMLAEAYNRQGNHGAALALYQQVDAAAPENPQVAYLAGVTQLRAQDRDAARQSFESALQNNPLHLQSVEQLTALDLSEQSFASALQRVESSLELAPDTAVLYVIRAQILNSMQRPEDAEASFKQALELDPDNRSAHLLLSRHYAGQGETDRAISHLDTLLENDPDDLATLTTLANLQEREGRIGEARQTYRKILETAPENLQALNNLAYLTSSQDGPTDEALQLAERARRADPNSPYVADTLGWIRYQRGEFSQAQALLSASASRLNDHPEVNYHLGAANYALGEIEAATERLRAATAGDANYSGIERARQMLQIAQIEPLDATESQVSLLQEAAASERPDPVALTKLGQIDLARGDTEAALAKMRKALEVVPQNLFAQLQLAQALILDGQAAKALEIARKAAEQAPNNDQVNYALGKAAFATGDYSWAASLLSGARRQFSQDPQLFADLAKAQLAIGQLDNALASAQTWIQLAEPSDEATAFRDSLRLVASEGQGEAPPEAQADADALHLQLAHAFSELASGRAQAAQDGFESILATYPNQAHAKLGLAKILAPQPSQAQRASDLLNDARRTLSATPSLLATQGIASYQLGQHRQAAQAFSQIPSGQLDDPQALAFYGLALAAQGDTAAAATQLQRAAASDALPADLRAQVEAALQP